MPLGSSSDAPVINPGPSSESQPKRRGGRWRGKRAARIGLRMRGRLMRARSPGETRTVKLLFDHRPAVAVSEPPPANEHANGIAEDGADHHVARQGEAAFDLGVMHDATHGGRERGPRMVRVVLIEPTLPC